MCDKGSCELPRAKPTFCYIDVKPLRREILKIMESFAKRFVTNSGDILQIAKVRFLFVGIW